MQTVKACPVCNRVLEPVESVEGNLLGYFCLNILTKSCNYIDVMSSTELRSRERYEQNKSPPK